MAGRRTIGLYAAGILVMLSSGCAGKDGGDSPASPKENPRLAALAPAELPQPPDDPTNRYVGDPRAATLGKQLFFDTRFSGPLLDEAKMSALMSFLAVPIAIVWGRQMGTTSKTPRDSVSTRPSTPAIRDR